MKKVYLYLQKIVIYFLILSLFGQNIAFAKPIFQEGKPRVDHSDTTGKMVFIGADPTNPIFIRAAQAPGITRSQRAIAMISQYANEFGLQNPTEELSLESEKQLDDRNISHFQQKYQGIPVIGGEVVVNSTNSGQLLSISGEISPDINLNIKPKITQLQAIQTAQELIKKSYSVDTTNILISAPELWIYDSRLLKPNGISPTLVWRMEAQVKENLPVRELILIDANYGRIVLHFNQIDTSWRNSGSGYKQQTEVKQEFITPTPTASPTPEPPLDQPTGESVSQDEILPTPTDLSGEILPTSTPMPVDKGTTQEDKSPPVPQATVNYYVDITNGNNGNSCTSAASPCKNIQEAINKAPSGSTAFIYITAGTYNFSSNPTPNVVIINKGNIILTLSGGWNSNFTLQDSVSIIDGERGVAGTNKNNNGILVLTGTITIENFIIQNSTSTNSGGIYMVNGNLTIKRSTIKNNLATVNGGGIFIDNGALTLVNSTLSGNMANSGAGLYLAINSSASATILNSTIASNTATSQGGGITKTNNATISITNTILANNTAPTGADCNGSINIANNNIIENPSGCTISSGSINQNVDPVLSSGLSGPFQVFTPQLIGPVFNSGTNSGCPTEDQIGTTRPQSGTCDIGSIEIPSSGVNTIYIYTGNNQTAEINTGYPSPLVALALDGSNQPMSGVEITFTASGSGAGITFSSTGTNTMAVTTDANGFATTSNITANGSIGSFLITASSSGYTDANFQLTNTPSGAIYPYTGNNQTTIVNTAFSAPLVALVLNNSEEPVSGVDVTFTMPANGASAVFSSTGTNTMTVTSDANGYASTSSVIANSTNGNFSISASASGYTSTNFQLTNTLSANSNGRYVAKNGSDSSNNCSSPSSPCLTINNALTNAIAGDTIYLTNETYTAVSGSSVLAINKNISISGGWDETFSTNIGYTILDGENIRRVIYVSNGSNLTLRNLIIQNGYSAGQGGGIYILNGAINISNSIIRNNSAEKGGGIHSDAGSLTVSNSMLYYNTAQTGGSSIHISGGNINIEYTTIAHNTSMTNGSGIRRTSGTLNITSSIIAYNSPIDCDGGINTIKYSIISNSTRCSLTNLGGMFLDIDPLISPPLEHGEIVLLPSSPAINHAEAASCPNQDISKKSRPIGAGCDIGAWESINTIGSIPVGIYISPLSNQTVLLSQNALTALSAMVIDQNNAPVPGVNVTFTSPASGQSGVFSNNSNSITVTTNASGLATTSYKANGFPGTYFVQASSAAIPEGKSIAIKNSPSVKTYTMNGSGDESLLPGTFVCDVINFDCSDNSNAQYAQNYALATYDFYYTQHGRRGFDDQNLPIVSSVNFGTSYNNAYWSGTQVVYGNGFPNADDIVAHELTHAVTQYESNLYYYYQSGAISESLSDIWGEIIDQQNGYGNDTSGVKWLIGEDLSGGAFRDMGNPPTYGDPDKMTSPYYYTGSDDDGGVHQNSGVNNKAAYLLVEGGTFNNKTVTALGVNKTLAIYYEVQTNLLTSGSDYADLYNLLYQACVNLIDGAEGITVADCQEVRDATDAVEMNLQPSTGYNPEAQFCGTASPYAVTVYQEDFENGLSSWTISNGSTLRWQQDSPYGSFAHSGQHFLYADDYPQNGTSTNATAQWSAKNIPSNAYLHFAHAYDFETSHGEHYDGGIIEYSVNGGGWINASSLIDTNGYNGVISSDPDSTNPLKGKPAFVDASHGYVSTRLNLSSLAGKSVSFRWRMGLDQYVSSWGWWVDDIRIYTCSDQSITISGSVDAPGITLRYIDSTLKTVTSNPDGSYSISVPIGWSGTVSPLNNTCFTFTPSNKSFSNVTSNKIGQNFVSNGIAGTTCLLSIKRKDTSPTASKIVHFTVTFTEDVTGVDTDGSDFELNVSGITGASITGVSPVSASVYTVSVYTGTGNGAIWLDIPNTATIKDLSNNNLNNLPFNTGEEYAILPSKSVVAPKLSLPRQNSITNDTTPTFNWNRNSYDAEYEIVVASDAAFSNIILSDTSISNTYTSSTPFGDGKYFWRVRALNRDGQPGKYSSSQTFSIDTAAPQIPVLTSPMDSAILKSSPMFRWNRATGAVLYEFQYDNDTDFSNPTYSVTTRNAYIKPPAMSKELFYWRVRAQDTAGNWSMWSTIRSLTISR